MVNNILFCFKLAQQHKVIISGIVISDLSVFQNRFWFQMYHSSFCQRGLINLI